MDEKSEEVENMDVHDELFMSFVVHNLNISQLEIFWAGYEALNKLETPVPIRVLGRIKENKPLKPITNQEIKTFKFNLDKIKSFKDSNE